MPHAIARPLAVALIAALTAAGLAAQAAPPPPTTLQRAAFEDLAITRDPATGVATFVRGAVASGVDRAALLADPEGAALGFLVRHAEALGLPDVDRQLELLRTGTDEIGMTHVRFRQVLEGVPVYGMQVIVHFAPSGEVVRAVNGDFVPGLDVRTRPLLGARRAAALARSIEPEGALHGPPELVVYTQHADPAVVGDHLAWLVRLDEPEVPSRTLYVVDARSGAVLVTRDELPTALNRLIYDANGTTTGVLTRSEGQGTTGNAEVDSLYDLLGAVYAYYLGRHGRDSWNGAGAAILGVVNWDGPEVNDCPNAFWNGLAVNFCTGAAVDDVVAHELTHAVTETSAGLLYQGESGALNEAYSDIMGEIFDLDTTYGDGSASPWLIAEGSSLGVIRSMSNPPAYGDPDRGSNFVCTSSDNGGVHTNSGIANKAAWLMAVGGTFNGQTVTGIGEVETAAIHYRALTQYLTPTSGYAADAAALRAACADLYSSTDCAEVDMVVLATEMEDVQPCDVPCPLQVTASSVSQGEPSAGAGMLLTLYRTRDRVLRTAPYGRHLAALYYEHGPEMSRILRADESLQRRVAALVARLTPGLEALVRDDGSAETLVVTPHTAALLASVLRSLEEQAAPEGGLAQAIRAERAALDLAGIPGRSLAAVWSQVRARGAGE
jgi:bacillolysin